MFILCVYFWILYNIHCSYFYLQERLYLEWTWCPAWHSGLATKSANDTKWTDGHHEGNWGWSASSHRNSLRTRWTGQNSATKSSLFKVDTCWILKIFVLTHQYYCINVNLLVKSVFGELFILLNSLCVFFFAEILLLHWERNQTFHACPTTPGCHEKCPNAHSRETVHKSWIKMAKWWAFGRGQQWLWIESQENYRYNKNDKNNFMTTNSYCQICL